ncbi:hypothetical protein JP74_21870 [Devosia sp. 17-2-E-8]|nr:hypothetical protein JP74_21870 [Devosia sp. 17-2-E-8]
MSDLVLLTGISGFLGGHVALQLLRRGFRVRGSVRDLGKAEKVRATMARHGADIDRLEFVALDLLADAGWREALADVRYLQHTASPFFTTMPADRMDLIRPAVEGTERAIGAALAGDVERIVLTSSMAAIAYGHEPARRDFSAADWTNLSGPGVNAYTESKTLAERRAWEMVDGAGRHGLLTTINPSVLLGPLLDDDPGTSAALVGRLLDGSVPAAPRIAFGIVDVRDVAALHVAAMTDPRAAGQRLPISEATVSLIEASRALAKALPEQARKVPRFEMPDWLVRLYALFDSDVRGNLGELGIYKTIDSTAARAILGHPLIPATDAVIASARSLLAEKLA